MIQKLLYALLRSLFEFFVHYFNLGDAHETWKDCIHLPPVFFHLLLVLILWYTGSFERREIRVNKGNDLFITVDDHTFLYIYQVIQLGLDFFGVDILPRRSQKHAFASSFNIHVLIFIDDTQIT